MTENLALKNNRAGNVSEIYTNSEYLNHNAKWHVEDSVWKAVQISKILTDNNLKPSTICEVGCGAGAILEELDRLYPTTNFVGFEVSPQAFELCKARGGVNTKYFLKNIFEESVFFDCLLCIDVFEHVEDYIGFLKALKSKSNYKIFHIPLEINVLSIIRQKMLISRKQVGHLHYFTRETALATLEDCGYEIIDKFYTEVFLVSLRNSFKGKLWKFIYQILYSISEDLTAKLIGGCSLIVLAK